MLIQLAPSSILALELSAQPLVKESGAAHER